ncbi:hypothetical protein NHH73_18625 [Oxalobacteraceae bacterium OTU3CINTB1]|nr:hypothetical protein NHH73_18625 [Oxalobacteraceae bacterium OTU3CINTB1]
MTDITIRFPRPVAIFFLLAGLPVFVFLTLVAVWMTLSLHTLAGKFPTWGLVAAYVIFPATVVLSCASVLFIFRYGRETLFTTFRFIERGINVENSRYRSLIILWSDIDSATYSRSLKIVVLRSRKLATPIAISQWANFPEAVRLTKQKIGLRWVEKWL